VQAIAFDLNRTRRLTGDAKTQAELLDGFLLDLELRQSDKGLVGLDTGFSHLNHVLGGLQQGLYIFAGAPSCGKTTFLVQLADKVAQLGSTPVLFFSFEQSRDELTVKSLARLASINTRDIVKGRSDATYCQNVGGQSIKTNVWDAIQQAAQQYRRTAERIRIIEADHETTLDKIRIMAQAAKHQAGTDRILVIVDYLQIIPTAERFASTKDKVDWLCSQLRRLARDLDSPVVAISSENRDAYRGNKKPTLAAFKESGGIEYSADVAGAFWTDAEKGDNINRAVRLYIIKNRNGELANIDMTFKADVATFQELDKREVRYAASLQDEQT